MKNYGFAILIIICVSCSFFNRNLMNRNNYYNSVKEHKQLEKYLDKQFLKDVMGQYEMASNNYDKYIAAAMLAEFYLQANDESNYRMWDSTRKWHLQMILY